MKRTHSKISGFSLVELSIVLVILGLLVGGILAGKSLIRASELRLVTTEQQRYYTALQSFKTKYMALPGDMNNAVQFWGQGATFATCWSTASTDKTTCNGDGDGLVEEMILTAFTRTIESSRAWQHLANAELIEGKYDGMGFGGSRIKGNVWIMSYLDVDLMGMGSTNFFELKYGNPLYTAGTILTPEEAWSIDNKLDDGKPAVGKVLVKGMSSVAECTTATAGDPPSPTIEYLKTGSNKVCGLAFPNQI
jgi:prepilin-type N-terminal cleavage/methylation domain-containing protein